MLVEIQTFFPTLRLGLLQCGKTKCFHLKNVNKGHLSHLSINDQLVDCPVITCIKVKYIMKYHIAKQYNKKRLAAIRNRLPHILYSFLQIGNETFL